MFCRGLPFKYTSSLIIIILSITACTHIPPRADESGAPLKDYTYHAPLQINDGWQVSSLAEEGVNEEIINVGYFPASDDAIGNSCNAWLVVMGQ